MLDLNILQKKLDDALERETTDSLNAWLDQKRNGRLFSTLFESGELIDLETICETVTSSRPVQITGDQQSYSVMEEYDDCTIAA